MYHMLNFLSQEKNQCLVADNQTVTFGGLVKSEKLIAFLSTTA